MAIKILLVGGGKMGGAILQRVAHTANACVVDPAPPQPHLKSLSGVAWLAKPEEIEERFKPDIIVLAIKPQQALEVIPYYGKYKRSLFLSIIAGLSLATLANNLGDKSLAIVRAMPNLPASLGEGITVAIANKNVNADQRQMADKLLKDLGTVNWIEDENWLDAVTAISGSGPAYLFALTESMARAGESLGLPAKFANTLARQTVIGSSALMANSTEAPEALRNAVTSPGGTTEAAFKVLLSPTGLFNLMAKAIKSAAQHSKELGR